MRILLVEDEHRIAQAIKKGLEQERYAVDVAFTGTDGLDLAMSEDYDVIILDRMLPGMDGLQICTELRQQDIHTPILLLTAKGQTSDRVEGLDAGADDYLPKPFAFEELIARVRALSRRSKQTTHVILEVAGLSLNTNTFAVTRDKQLIQLSSKEFSLLEYLMRHSPAVVTKEQIIAHVWNYDADILPNTVEVYIKNIRAKVDQPFPKAEQLIKTVRGFGYKMEESNV
ncbi:response regulator transcription factor [Candidatus Woesebacteria bacterium]|nr:response regulator transcription factor [Candidatus Woesebacteria bacterium]